MFNKTVAMMGLADAIYFKGKRTPKWADEQEAKYYNIGFKYGKDQLN